MCPLDYVKELTSSQFLLPKHLTPASALWSQLWYPIPEFGQIRSEDSVPLHPTLSRKIPPLPLPK